MEATFESLAGHAALFLEVAAILIVLGGAIEAIARLLRELAQPPRAGTRREVWLRFAGWLLLGLEFALAADIVRTAISPTWDDLGQLAVIAAVRTFLNYFLERDIRETVTTAA